MLELENEMRKVDVDDYSMIIRGCQLRSMLSDRTIYLT